MVFYHQERDLSLVVHEDDFTCCGLEEDLIRIRYLLLGCFEVNVRGIMGPGMIVKKL